MDLIRLFFRRIIAGYFAPRASARMILSSGGGLAVAVQLVLLGYLISSILVLADPAFDRPEGFSFIGTHVVGLGSSFITFFVFSALIFFFGRLAGGKGSQQW